MSKRSYDYYKNEVSEFIAKELSVLNIKVAIDKLLKRESLSKKLLEVSAGEGHLAEKLKMYGYDVITNDIVERNYKLDYRLDFLSGGGYTSPGR